MDIINKGVEILRLSMSRSNSPSPPASRTPSVTSSVTSEECGLTNATVTPIRTPSNGSEVIAIPGLQMSTIEPTKQTKDILPASLPISASAAFKNHYLSTSPSHASPLSPLPHYTESYLTPTHINTMNSNINIDNHFNNNNINNINNNNNTSNIPIILEEENGKDYFTSRPILRKTRSSASVKTSSSLQQPMKSPRPLSQYYRTIHTVGSNKKYGTHAIFSGSNQRRKYHVKRNKHRKLRLDDFIIKQTLGTGAIGRVHLAESKFNKKHYAIKTLNKHEVVQKNQVDHTNNEFTILRDIAHPFLVTLWDAFQNDTHLFMVLDYEPGGELFTLLRKQKKFTEEATRFYAAEVILALEYLHENEIIYRDLKPENILLDRKGHIKLTDFGFAKKVPSYTYTVCGTPDYLAPEIIRSNGYTKAVDWWSLGVLIYEMLVGCPPFKDKNPVNLYENILECRIDWPEDINPVVKDLLLGLLTPDLDKRYGVSSEKDIKLHPWFASIDFDMVFHRQLIPPHVPTIKNDGDAACFGKYKEPEHPYGKNYISSSTTDPYRSKFPAF
ncbi:unnamed protein product [Cunninghamella echinulata]